MLYNYLKCCAKYVVSLSFSCFDIIMKKVIEVKNVTMQFNQNTVFQDANFDIFEHESVVIIGPSGAGKSVLLKALAGVYPPTTGQILIEGEDWLQLESEEKHDLAAKLGMLFQQSALFDTMTALENVEFPMKEHFDWDEETIKSKALELLKKVNLADADYKLPNELSGGMQKRLGIARALALNPSIIFYDDPVAGQDPVQSDQMINLIMDLRKANDSTLVMVTSSLKVAFKVATKIILVVGQDVLVTGTPEETKSHPDPRVQQFINARTTGPIKIE